MKEIKVKKDFSLNGKYYFEGDNITKISYEDLVKINEKGFIEPLTLKELLQYKNKKEIKEEIE